MEYTVIFDAEIERLIRKVNKAITEGWVPLGGVGHNGNSRWAQAMIKTASPAA